MNYQTKFDTIIANLGFTELQYNENSDFKVLQHYEFHDISVSSLTITTKKGILNFSATVYDDYAQDITEIYAKDWKTFIDKLIKEIDKELNDCE